VFVPFCNSEKAVYMKLWKISGLGGDLESKGFFWLRFIAGNVV